MIRTARTNGAIFRSPDKKGDSPTGVDHAIMVLSWLTSSCEISTNVSRRLARHRRRYHKSGTYGPTR